MSALPAEITELPPATVGVFPTVDGTQLRAERRAEQLLARRSRRRWATLSLAILISLFALTVGILDVLH